MDIFKERLVALTQIADVTQQKLAAETGIPQQTLSRYLTGKQTPDLERLVVLCNYFNVTADYLVGLEND